MKYFILTVSILLFLASAYVGVSIVATVINTFTHPGYFD